MKTTIKLPGMLLLAVIIAGCRMAPQPAGASPTAAGTLTPAEAPSTAASTVTPAPADGLTLHIDPERLWALRIPPALAHVEEVDEAIVRLGAEGSAAFAAVDSYPGTAEDDGNTGEGLRNRARAALAALYGRPVDETGIVEPSGLSWQTGITFTAPDGARGEALYTQPNRDQGDYRAYGFLFACPSGEEESRSTIELLRDSFKPVTVLQLHPPDGSTLWAIYSYGLRTFNPGLEREHFLAIYAREGATWRLLDQLLLDNPDYVPPGAARSVRIEPSRVWLTLEGGVGAHGSSFELFSFDGKRLKSEITNTNSSPGAGAAVDLDGDIVAEVVLNDTDNYVFCYACSVRYPRYRLLRWDGTHLAEITLTPLPDTAPERLRRPLNRAIELAQAGLWKDAQAAASEAQSLAVGDPAAAWQARLILLHAEAFAGQAQEGIYPLLDNVFYGDYGAALDIVRRYRPEEIWSPQTPLVAGTVAEGQEDLLTDWLTQTTALALQAKPDLAAAYLLRGWGVNLTSPGSPQALADVERAAQLDPSEKLYTESLAYLKER